MSSGSDSHSELASASKRALLKAATAVAVASTLPAVALRAQAAANGTYDVIVIGGGTAGLPLALFAAQRNARVLIIDKAPILGGTLDRSWASTAAAGSRLQKSAGIDDSPQDHYDDIMRSVRYSADPVIVRLWTDNAADTVNWLQDIGVKFSSVPKKAPEDRGSANYGIPKAGKEATYTTPRVQMVEGRGAALIKAFVPLVDKAVAAGKVTVRLNSRAIELIQDAKGTVVGVTVEDEKGQLQDFSGKQTVLTSGGCAANPRMFQELHEFPLYYAAGYPFNQGDGLMLGQSAGGYLKGAEGYIPRFGLVMSDEIIPSTPTNGTYQETMLTTDVVERPPWGIWVNAKGERFTQEDSLVAEEREYALKEQLGHRFWMVHDQEAFDKAPSPMQGWTRDKYVAGFQDNPMFFKARTVEQLALKLGIEPRAMVTSIGDYNRALKENTPDRFGRVIRPAPIARAPFYAVQFQGFCQQSFAGLAVDHNLRVMRRDGTAVAGLYAAGEILGSTAVGNPAHAAGSLVTPAITFGRLLGQRILNV